MQVVGWEGEEHRGLVGPWRKGAQVGGRKGASHLVPSPLLPEIHLVLQVRWGHAGGQLVGSIGLQDLLCLSDDQDGWGWLHCRNRTGLVSTH